jgi:hypothetical protein
MNIYTNIFEVSEAVKNAVERVTGKTDIAAAVENLAVGGMGFGVGEETEDRSGSSVRATCATSFCS